MKRLLSFVLVAMMLVSVVPFQASAAGDMLKIVFADGNVIDQEINDTNKDETCVAGFYKADGTSVEGIKKDDLRNQTVYQAGYPISFGLTIKNVIGASAGQTATASVAVPDAFDSDKAATSLKSQLSTLVTDYATLYTDATVTADAAAKTATVVLTAKAEEAWTIIVNKDGTTAHTTTANFRLTPNGESEALKNAVKVVTDGIDQTNFNYTVGNWSIDDTNKIASVNVTTTAKPVVKPEYKVTFRYCGEQNHTACAEEGTCASVTRTTVDQKLPSIDVPVVPDRYGYSFDYWKNTSNGTKGLQDTYTSDVTYTAVYKKDADSNLHKLKVFGVTYNHGKTNILSTPLATIYVKDEADLLTALQAETTAIQAAIKKTLADRGYSGYVWDGVTFYDDSDMGSDDKVATGTEVTGNGNYYVKLNYTGNNKVQLYIHTSKTLSIKDTVTLTTYAVNDTISKSQITTAVKNDGWSFDTIRTYTQDSWEKIVDRNSSSAANETKSFEVVEGETEIHVYLTGASSSSSNKSDNPKTGDSILMAVTVLGLSASALAAVYFISKKKRSV